MARSDDKSSPLHESSVQPEPGKQGIPRSHLHCSCGRPLKVQVTREGVILRCPEHGIQFRYFVPKKNKS